MICNRRPVVRFLPPVSHKVIHERFLFEWRRDVFVAEVEATITSDAFNPIDRSFVPHRKPFHRCRPSVELRSARRMSVMRCGGCKANPPDFLEDGFEVKMEKSSRMGVSTSSRRPHWLQNGMAKLTGRLREAIPRG